MNHSPVIEKRRNVRVPRSDAIVWNRASLPDRFPGLAIEGSADDLAFAWRGCSPPARGTILGIRRAGAHSDPADGEQRAVVRRSAVLHADLCLIAVEMIRARPFPPCLAAIAEPRVRIDGEPLGGLGEAPVAERRHGQSASRGGNGP